MWTARWDPGGNWVQECRQMDSRVPLTSWRLQRRGGQLAPIPTKCQKCPNQKHTFYTTQTNFVMRYSELFDPSPSEDTPIACDLTVLDNQKRHKSHAAKLFGEREEVRKVPGGVALRFPGTMEYAERVLDFISRERQCCPFLTFEVIFEPEERGVWLFLGGGSEAESYIQSQFREKLA